MAISPQYSHKWKIIPYAEGDKLTADDECYITWNADIKYYQESVNPKWDIIAAPFSLSLAQHIVETHNDWVDDWYETLPFEDEVEPGFCGNTRPRPAPMVATGTTEAVIHAFGGYYPLAADIPTEEILEIYASSPYGVELPPNAEGLF